MPKSKTPSKDEIDDIIDSVKDIKVSDSLPQELDNMSDIGDTDDTEDIINNFEHEAYKEYKDLVFFQNISVKCAAYFGNASLKLNESQKKKIKILINKIYAKMIIYSHSIDLNNLHEIYKDYDEKCKELVFRIRTFVFKITESSFELRKKRTLSKKELKIFFNNCSHLFSLLIEILDKLTNKSFESDDEKSIC